MISEETRTAPCRLASAGEKKNIRLFARMKSRVMIAAASAALLVAACDAEVIQPALDAPSSALEASSANDRSGEETLQPGDSVRIKVGDMVHLELASAAQKTALASTAAVSSQKTGEKQVKITTNRSNHWIRVTVVSSKGFDATRLTGSGITFGTANRRTGVAKRPDGSYMIKGGDFDSDGRRGVQFYFDAEALGARPGRKLNLESMYLLGNHPRAGSFRGGAQGNSPPPEQGDSPSPQKGSKRWSSQNESVATVSQNGFVQAVAVGTAQLNYGGPQAHESVYVVVSPSEDLPPTSGKAARATLPRQVVDTRMPATSGRVIRVPARGDLQAALDAARPGDVVELQAGATYEGSFTLPPKAGDDWIIVRSSAYAQLPEGRRVEPTDARYLAKLVGGFKNQRVLRTEAGAHHYRLVGLEIALASKDLPGLVNTIVEFGIPVTRKADGSKKQSVAPNAMPHHLILDRTYIHGTERQSLNRCVILNSAWSAVIDSYLSECHAKGFDSQAIAGWSGPGPFKIQNNFLSGAGENVMFGGAAVGPGGAPPADIEIRGNHFYKPLSWKGRWTVKNLFELKIAERVLVEGNTFENLWADAQVGFAINLKSENRNVKDYPNLATRDVTFRNNKIINSRFGATIIGGASTKAKTGEGRTERIVMQNNLWDIEDRAFQVSGASDVILEQNTATGKVNIEGQMPNLVMRDNLIGGPVKGSGSAEGMGTLENRAPGWVFEGNAIVGGTASAYPKGNEFPTSLKAYRGKAGTLTELLERALLGR